MTHGITTKHELLLGGWQFNGLLIEVFGFFVFFLLFGFVKFGFGCFNSSLIIFLLAVINLFSSIFNLVLDLLQSFSSLFLKISQLSKEFLLGFQSIIKNILSEVGLINQRNCNKRSQFRPFEVVHTLVFDYIGDIHILVLNFNISLLVGYGVVQRQSKGSPSNSLVQKQSFIEHQIGMGGTRPDVIDHFGLRGVKMGRIVLILIGDLAGRMFDIANIGASQPNPLLDKFRQLCVEKFFLVFIVLHFCFECLEFA